MSISVVLQFDSSYQLTRHSFQHCSSQGLDANTTAPTVLIPERLLVVQQGGLCTEYGHLQQAQVGLLHLHSKRPTSATLKP